MVTYDNDLLARNIIGNGNLPVQPKQARPKYKLSNTAGVARDLLQGQDTSSAPNPAMQSLRKFGGMIKENILDPTAKGLSYINPIDANRRVTGGLQKLPQAMRDYDERSTAQIRQATTDRADNPQGVVHVAPWMQGAKAQQSQAPDLPGQDYQFDPSRFKGDEGFDAERFKPTVGGDRPEGNIPRPEGNIYNQEVAEQYQSQLPQREPVNLQDRVSQIKSGTAALRDLRSDATVGQSFSVLPQSGLGNQDKRLRDFSKISRGEMSGKMARHFDQLGQQEKDRAVQGSQFQQSLGQKERGQQLVADTSRLRQSQDRRQQDFKNQLGLAGLRQKVSAAEAKNKPKEQSVSDVIKTNAEITAHYNDNPDLIELYKLGGSNVNSMTRVDNALASAKASNADATEAELIEIVKRNLANPGA